VISRPLLRRIALVAAVTIVALGGGGCATPPVAAPDAGVVTRPAAHAVLRSLAIDRALEDRILALDPERVTADDVRDTLAKGPAPRIILLHGGIYPVYLMMESAGRFLTGMGYPESRIRHPGDGRWSHSPYEHSAQIAGFIAWHYERDGMRPMMIGHSQGGIQAIKVLYELAGRFDDPIRVWNPLADAAEIRTSIVDPLTGAERPVVGLSVSYVSVVGAGGAALLLPNQWSMVGKMRTIPDAVDEFTGFAIGLDFFAWTYPGDEDAISFRRDGNTLVRGVMLPAWYNHVFVPDTERLAADPATRAWIDAYRAADAGVATPPAEAGDGVLWAADVWYSVKKHWTIEAQRLIRARRAVADRLK
jgi:hypothetical protein